jgi:hypothetical protein
VQKVRFLLISDFFTARISGLKIAFQGNLLRQINCKTQLFKHFDMPFKHGGKLLEHISGWVNAFFALLPLSTVAFFFPLRAKAFEQP